MILKSTFKIDQFQLRETKDKDGLIKAYTRQAAADFGLKIIELFPFVKNEELSNRYPLPALSMNKDHQFVDVYERELVVFDYNELMKMAKTNPEFEPIIKHLCAH